MQKIESMTFEVPRLKNFGFATGRQTEMNLTGLVRKVARGVVSPACDSGPRLWELAPQIFSRLVMLKDPCMAFIYALHRAKKSVVFVQVGSNDGSFGDPLAPFLHTEKWSGVMIEPVEYIFQRLVRKHGQDPSLAFENVAIAPAPGERNFYYLEETTERLPEWYDQLGSFSLETILKHEAQISRLRERIKAVRVRCSTLDEICHKHGIYNLDLIHIDTEGFDYEVLRLIDFESLRPGVILFEHKHLSDSDKKNALHLLAKNKYAHCSIGSDTLSVREDIFEQDATLSMAWKKISGMPVSEAGVMQQSSD